MTVPTSARNARTLAPLFAWALLLSALLLFWVQPMFTKLVLPRYGGSPAVWTTALMFFQVALLAGYCYAHLSVRWLPFKQQIVLHLALLVLVLFVLPIHLHENLAAPDVSPITSLLLLLTTGLGLPFFALAATAPLLQRWFSYTRAVGAADPYFLYSASNLGSMIALAGYPTVIELFLGLSQQSAVWASGYGVLAALITLCAVSAWRMRAAVASDTAATAAPPAEKSSSRQRLHWIVLAFAPSSLLLGVTQHITSEIAAVPLLWVIPLLLYMATFVIVFARRPWPPHRWVLRSQPWLVILLVLVWVLNNYLSIFLVHLLVFFVTALLCHGELARRRPSVSRLTEFYLCISLGGALGGIFNAVIAPQLFNSLIEYPLVIALACMLRPPRTGDALWRWTDIALPLLLAVACALLIAIGFHPFKHGTLSVVLYLEVVGIALYLFHPRPIRFGLGVAVILLASPALHDPEQVLARHRSFFGVHTVLQDETNKFHVLMNGATVHGAQHLAAATKLEPTTYYHRESPLGQLLRVIDHRSLPHVAAIGLGTGTVACYRKPGQAWDFYELDPVVVGFARDTRYFSFLADCAPQEKILLGDGRLSLQSAADGYYELIIVDTFSSDAIPVHMITREALALYLRKLTADGILIFHITNQYLDLQPVLGNLAADADIVAMVPGPRMAFPPEDRFSAMESEWVVMARRPQLLDAMASEEGWALLPAPAHARLWTDDYSNIFGALR